MTVALSLLAQYRVGLLLGATLVVALALVPGFASPITAGLSLDRAASVGLIAVGLTLLLAAGQIDLSGGAVFALTGIVATILQPALGVWPAAAVGVAAGLTCGAVNGLVVVGLRINSLVATLATLLVFRALSHWLTESQPVSGTDVMVSLVVSELQWGVLTIRAGLFLLLILLLHLCLTRTVAGRNVLAIGSNPAAA
jgi:ribose transport system permease protein